MEAGELTDISLADRFPLVHEFGLRRDDAIPAASWGFEDLFLDAARCPCGGCWSPLASRVEQEARRTLERVDARCRGCGRRRPFWFDITLFHGDPDAWMRAEVVRAALAAGRAAVHGDRYEEAIRCLEDAAGMEPWWVEPHRLLALDVLVVLDPPAALERMARVAALQPLAVGHHQLLWWIWDTLGDTERARRARDSSELVAAIYGEEEG